MVDKEKHQSGERIHSVDAFVGLQNLTESFRFDPTILLLIFRQFWIAAIFLLKIKIGMLWKIVTAHDFVCILCVLV